MNYRTISVGTKKIYIGFIIIAAAILISRFTGLVLAKTPIGFLPALYADIAFVIAALIFIMLGTIKLRKSCRTFSIAFIGILIGLVVLFGYLVLNIAISTSNILFIELFYAVLRAVSIYYVFSICRGISLVLAKSGSTKLALKGKSIAVVFGILQGLSIVLCVLRGFSVGGNAFSAYFNAGILVLSSVPFIVLIVFLAKASKALSNI